MSLLTSTTTGPADSRPPTEPRYYLTDGGLETFLVFDRGMELPEFASFPLLLSEAGRSELNDYFDRYLEIAARDGHGFVIDTPTWRANREWGAALGYDAATVADINRHAVEVARAVAARHASVDTVINGIIGPRGDGYVVDTAMTQHESAKYHWLQVGAFAEAGADMVSAVTLTYANEAIGIVDAARSQDIPVVIGFTVETDGRLPSGQPLLDAIDEVDDNTQQGAAWFMVNCAHPSHFEGVLDPSRAALHRIGSIRANASRQSHEELDAAEELDSGDPVELGGDYARLSRLLPSMRVVGGCCGTDHHHIDEVSRALAG